jgi:hypothetical protein
MKVEGGILKGEVGGRRVEVGSWKKELGRGKWEYSVMQ